MKYVQESFDGENDLLAGVNGMRSPVHVTLDPSKMSADAMGGKSMPPGFWVAASGDLGRPLPRTKAASGADDSDTVITVQNAQVFVPGDVLRVVPASAQIDLTGTWAISNTLTVTVGGASYVHTAASADTTAIAVAAATEFNANPTLRGLASAIAGGGSLYILARDFVTPYAITVAAAGGDAAAAVADSQSVLLSYRTVGTIDANGVNVAAGELTLANTAAIALPAGMPLGTSDTPIGLHLRSLDLLEQAVEVGLYTSVSLKKGALPYWDDGLAKLFPEIQIVGK